MINIIVFAIAIYIRDILVKAGSFIQEFQVYQLILGLLILNML